MGLGSCINDGCSNNPDTACMFNSFLLFITFWILAGFNTSKAIDVYQQKKLTLHFPCPYNKTGSCSEAFRQGGIKALIYKCNDAKKQYYQE
jgi:hypothetical protein